MYKNYIVRSVLYPEEDRNETGFSLQVCVTLKKKYIIMGKCQLESIVDLDSNEDDYEPIEMIEYDYLTVYVKSNELALKLAQRYCDENKDKSYEVVGIDKAYSIFD